MHVVVGLALRNVALTLLGGALMVVAQTATANTAPTLDSSKSPQLVAEIEDPGPPAGAVGTPVSSLVDFAAVPGGLDNVSDPDAGAVLGIALVGVDSSNGTWFYTINGGSTWTAVGAVSDASALLLPANANTRLYFNSSLNFNGTLSNAITFRAWDQTSGSAGATADTTTNGGTTAFSSASDTAALSITAVNDPPLATNLSAGETYTEDTALNLIDIVVSDPDSANVTATLTLSNTAAGILTTATSGAVTSTFNAGTGVWTASGPIPDVNTLLAAVSFVPALDFNANFTIATSVSDGVAPPIGGTKALTGIAVNDAPIAVTDSIAVNQGAATTTLVGGAGSVLANDSDVDGPGLSAQLVAAPAHSSTFVLNANGSFLYVHDNSSSASDSFVYRACDGATPSLCSADTAVTISVNLKPIPGCTAPDQILVEGDAVTLDLSGILVDPESQALIFAAAGAPPGLGLSTTGQMTGTVGAGAHTGSPYTVTITAWDPEAAAGTRDLIMQVLAPAELVFRNGFDDPAEATACR